jgi:hypothetical protein
MGRLVLLALSVAARCLLPLRFKCPLKPGSYRFRVKGGDGAGNVTPRPASNALVVTKARGGVARAVADPAGGLTPRASAAAPSVLSRSVAAAHWPADGCPELATLVPGPTWGIGGAWTTCCTTPRTARSAT